MDQNGDVLLAIYFENTNKKKTARFPIYIIGLLGIHT